MYSTPLRSDPFRAGCSVIERASGAEGEGVGGGSCNERDDADDAPGCLREGRGDAGVIPPPPSSSHSTLNCVARAVHSMATLRTSILPHLSIRIEF